jgi:hypothetical protein
MTPARLLLLAYRANAVHAATLVAEYAAEMHFLHLLPEDKAVCR